MTPSTSRSVHKPPPARVGRWLSYPPSKAFAFCRRLGLLAVIGCGFAGNGFAEVATGGLHTDEILRPEQAFRVSASVASVANAEQLLLEWTIAKGYYLYRKRFRFVAASADLALGAAHFPKGEVKDDEFFGPMEIYRNRLRIPLEVTDHGATGKLTVVVTSQGCADIGICFPPMQTRLTVDAGRLQRAAVGTGDILTMGPTLGRKMDALPVLLPGATSATRLSLAPAPIQMPIQSPIWPSSRPPIRSPIQSPIRSDPQSSDSGADRSSTLDALLGTGTEPAFLHPDQAFVASARALDATTLEARWDIAPGHYLYRNKMRVSASLAGADVPITRFDLPAGKVKQDEYFGAVETFRDNVVATVHLGAQVGGMVPLALKVGYQGCADAGLCYPPVEKTMSVGLDGSEGKPGSISAPNLIARESTGPVPSALSEQDRIARTLASSSLWLVVATFYTFGLLLAFTPCVLPMVPILSSILVGQQSRAVASSKWRSFGLSAAYVGAMAITYSAIGILAGQSGANLQIWFQHPAVLFASALVFIALAASMFGLYELQLPSAWQSALSRASSRERGGSYMGAAIMGLFSALIVGPCVAAPLAGALIYISQTGDGALGGLALLALALGMGSPLLVLGASAGSILPRVGPWMKGVNRIFGFVLLGVAIYLLERILPPWLSLGLWAVLFIVGAIFMGALDTLEQATSGWRRLWKGAGIATLVYGVALMVGAAAGGHDVFNPLAPLSRAGRDGATLPFRDVKGVKGLNQALTRAQEQGKPVLLDYYADWCVSCKELEKYTFGDSEVQALLSRVELLRTDVTRNDAEDQALLKRFGLFGPPAILFFDLNGTERPGYRIVGFMGPEAFRTHALSAFGAVTLAAQ